MLVIAVAGAVYANSLDGALLFDDTNAIVRNTRVHEGDALAILTQPSWWTEGRGRAWRPLTTLSFALNYALHGLAPRGYHLVNIVLHAGVSALVLAVFARVTGAVPAATAAALLFAAHPVHTEAVASVVGRAELLAAGGFFLAWLLFLRADGARRAWPFEAGGVTTFFCALLAKENAITLLPVLVLSDCLYPGPGRGPAATLRRHAPRYAALVVAGAVFVALRGTVIGGDAPGIDRLDNPLVALPFATRVLTAVAVLGLYAWRLLVPWRLSADYSYAQIPVVSSPLEPALLGGLAVLAGIPWLVRWAWRRVPPVALGAGFLVLTFALVANLLVLIGTIMAERLLYLPSAGFCLVLAGALAHRAGRAHAATTGPTRRALLRLALPVGLLVVLYGARTWTRNAVWRDPLTFFATMVADAPLSARSHRELGNALAAVGRSDEARRAFERSLAIKPGDAATLYNLGNALTHARQYDAAVDAYQQALAAKPDFVDAMGNLANAESMRGDQNAALAWIRRALAHTPGSASLRMNLANTLFRAGAIGEAQSAYEAALALAPASPELLTNYGMFLYARGDALREAGDRDRAAGSYQQALAAYERAASVSAPGPVTLVGLVSAYRATGRLADARATQARAERLFPGDALVRQMAQVLARDAAGGTTGP